MGIRWKTLGTLGNDRFDAQHMQLFDLVRQILATEDLAVITGLALQLHQHAGIHVAYEESLMRQHNYPGQDSHIASHSRLLGRLNTVRQDGQLDKSALDTLMTDWSLFHIPLEDARFVAYLKPAP